MSCEHTSPKLLSKFFCTVCQTFYGETETTAVTARDLRRAYSKGYNAGSRGAWPDHRPPMPPDEVTSRIVEAALALRNAVDGEIACFLDDEPVVEAVGPRIDALDEALAGLGRWVRASIPPACPCGPNCPSCATAATEGVTP